MTYLIDAWLDRPHPCLRILHRDTGEVCAVLDEDALSELRDQGDLDISELISCEPIVLKELVRNLFLFCYARALRPEANSNTLQESRGRRPADSHTVIAYRTSSSSTSNTRTLCGGMPPTP